MDIQEYIDEIVEAWPPFTDQQRTALSELLKPVKLTPQQLSVCDTQQKTA